MSEQGTTFGAWDYVVLILMLSISTSIGLYYRFTGGKQKTLEEYLLANKNMHIVPVAFSLMATVMSAIALLGASNENYSYGIQFLVINVSYGVATPIATYLYIPVFFKLQAISVYEYLHKRFGQATRLAASFAYCLQTILYMGIVLYAPALALEALTGISKTIAIFVIGAVCTFYSTLGGMKAVVWTDVFQSLLMFLSIFSVIISAAGDVGGLGEIWRIADEGGRISLFDFNPDPTIRHTWWTLVIGGAVTYLSLYAVSQSQIQRYLTVNDLKKAQTTLWLNWPIMTCLNLSTSLAGLAIYSVYYKCDPVYSGRISKKDQLMPLFVLDSMGHIPGLSGLFVAGIFSASLSSISSGMNSLAAITLEDYYKPLHKLLFKEALPESKSTFPSKIMAMIYGFVFMALAFIAEYLGGVLQASLTIFGAVGGPLLAIFTLGMFTTRANEKGALTGLIIGLSFTLWISFGGPKPPPPVLPVGTCNDTYNTNSTITSSPASDVKPKKTYFWMYKLSYLYTSLLGLIITFVVGYLVSLLTGSNKEPVNLNLLIPPLATKIMKKRLTTQNTNQTAGTSKNGKKISSD